MIQKFVEAVNTRCRQIMEDLIHTIAISKVEKVTENRLADVTPELKVVTDDGREVPYPKISGAKVFFPGGVGGKVGIVYPFKQGDKCVTLFGEGGSGSDLKWDLSNAILLPGFVDSVPDQAKKAGEDEALILFADDSTVKIEKDQIEIKLQSSLVTVKKDQIEIKQGNTTAVVDSGSIQMMGDVKVTGNISVIGNVSITGLLTVGSVTMNTHIHTAPVGGMTGGPI